MAGEDTSWWNPMSWFNSGQVPQTNMAASMQNYSMGPNSITDAGSMTPNAMLGVQGWGGMSGGNTGGIITSVPGQTTPMFGPAGGTNPANGMPPQAVGFGPNIGTGQLVLGGVQTAGNLWNAMQAQEMAKKAFAFNSRLATSNMANQIASYNMRLEDKTRSRAVAEGQTDQQRDDYVNRNRLAAFR